MFFFSFFVETKKNILLIAFGSLRLLPHIDVKSQEGFLLTNQICLD